MYGSSDTCRQLADNGLLSIKPNTSILNINVLNKLKLQYIKHIEPQSINTNDITQCNQSVEPIKLINNNNKLLPVYNPAHETINLSHQLPNPIRLLPIDTNSIELCIYTLANDLVSFSELYNIVNYGEDTSGQVVGNKQSNSCDVVDENSVPVTKTTNNKNKPLKKRKRVTVIESSSDSESYSEADSVYTEYVLHQSRKYSVESLDTLLSDTDQSEYNDMNTLNDSPVLFDCEQSLTIANDILPIQLSSPYTHHVDCTIFKDEYVYNSIDNDELILDNDVEYRNHDEVVYDEYQHIDDTVDWFNNNISV